MLSSLDHTDFVFAAVDLDAFEDLNTDELAKSIIEGVGVDSAYDTDCNNGACASQTASAASAAAIAAVDMLCIFFGSSELRNNFGLQQQYGCSDPEVRTCETRSGNTGSLLPDAINQFLCCLNSFFSFIIQI